MTDAPFVERRAYPRFRLAVRFSVWLFSWLEEKADDQRRLSGFRVVLAGFATAYVLHWPAMHSGPSVGLGVAILFAPAIRDLFRLIPAGEALAALRVFFENVMGKAASTVAGAGGYFASASSWAAGSVPMGGEVLGEDQLQPPVAHGRPDE